MNRPLIYSLAICVASALLEGIFAGSGISRRFAALRLPRYSLPLWGWIIIGGFYYVICCAVLYLLFSLPATPVRNSALALLGAIILANAYWNYLFFRVGNLFLAFFAYIPYNLLALALFVLLLRLDRIAALWFLPYLFYLCYANIWGYRIWKLNRFPAGVGNTSRWNQAM